MQEKLENVHFYLGFSQSCFHKVVFVVVVMWKSFDFNGWLWSLLKIKNKQINKVTSHLTLGQRYVYNAPNKQLQWTFYFLKSWQIGPFWAVLKLPNKSLSMLHLRMFFHDVKGKKVQKVIFCTRKSKFYCYSVYIFQKSLAKQTIKH